MFKITDLIKINDRLWEIPKDHRADMRVSARIYATEEMLGEITGDRSLDQLVNVATLPGIVGHAIAMPDVHEGYGFPVGGVAAFDVENGVISPGGIGYDINCGVRMLCSEVDVASIRHYIPKIGEALYREIPSGSGRGGKIELTDGEIDRVLSGGAARMIEMGYGEAGDLMNLESGGKLLEADPSLVSKRAKGRGRDQLGTMGSGNHFIEVEAVDAIFDEEEAERNNIRKGQVVIMIHTGSRGLGHQVATDNIRRMQTVSYPGTDIPDRELACAPYNSKEGREYFSAMSSAANFAWANRQVIAWEAGRVWTDILGDAGGKLHTLYDVAHNIAKIEEHEIEGKTKRLIIHRKGATRSFPGQPVLVPGSMGTGSYLLVGQEGAMKESFGSSCHGAGRRMSRTEARREIRGEILKEELLDRGISVNVGSITGLAEEAPDAYKDLEQVVGVIQASGIAKKVARLRPLAVIKG